MSSTIAQTTNNSSGVLQFDLDSWPSDLHRIGENEIKGEDLKRFGKGAVDITDRSNLALYDNGLSYYEPNQNVIKNDAGNYYIVTRNSSTNKIGIVLELKDQWAYKRHNKLRSGKPIIRGEDYPPLPPDRGASGLNIRI